MRRAAAALVTAAAAAALGGACGDGPITPGDAITSDGPGGDDAGDDAGDDTADAPVDADGGPQLLPVAGAIAPVHDPAVILGPTGYRLFATGEGLPVRTSVDLVNWSLAGQVFAEEPDWITTTGSPNTLWAPDVSEFGGEYHLYYSASSFGSNESCIGHATSTDLEAWTDRGAVICSTDADNWNAIDPNHAVDAAGDHWLAFGSFWGGLKLIRLDATGARDGTAMFSLSTRANTAVEAPFVVSRGGFYYLFESVDFCCQGAASTYKQMVGRADAITGPYFDRDGVALLDGGGTLLVEGNERWRGPGHDAVLSTPGGDYNVYHSYDAEAGGIPTLRIAELRWIDGWPVSAGP
jgi:arabinan endo-1,5-alpha-L-arabinosidase